MSTSVNRIKQKFLQYTQLLTECGRIVKPWKLKGEVVLKLSSNTWKQAYKKNFVFIGPEGHKFPIPYRIQKMRSIGKDLYIAKLKTIETRKEAQELQGLIVHVLTKKKRATQEFTQLYVEKEVEDIALGILGKVIEIAEYPSDKMLIVKEKNSEKEILIPFHFIKEIGDRIIVNLPPEFLKSQ